MDNNGKILLKILRRIENIEEKLESIEESMSSSSKSCTKMSEHIDFVESIYDVVRHPMNKVLSLVGKSEELPNHTMIEN